MKLGAPRRTLDRAQMPCPSARRRRTTAGVAASVGDQQRRRVLRQPRDSSLERPSRSSRASSRREVVHPHVLAGILVTVRSALMNDHEQAAELLVHCVELAAAELPAVGAFLVGEQRPRLARFRLAAVERHRMHDSRRTKCNSHVSPKRDAFSVTGSLSGSKNFSLRLSPFEVALLVELRPPAACRRRTTTRTTRCPSDRPGCSRTISISATELARLDVDDADRRRRRHVGDVHEPTVVAETLIRAMRNAGRALRRNDHFADRPSVPSCRRSPRCRCARRDVPRLWYISGT